MAQTYQRMRLTSAVRRGLAKIQEHAEQTMTPTSRADAETVRGMEWLAHMRDWRSAPRQAAKPKRRRRAA